ncbi:MAG: hypothetical protein WBK77_04020 [Alphaproteobacteria bacterium]
MTSAHKQAVYFLFTISLVLCFFAWSQVRDVKARWMNVPPIPAQTGAAAFALGDLQFSYRSTGIMLQNLGDTGGMSTGLKAYDYDRLAQWFTLADWLDPHSDFIPYLAAYYFGAVEDPEKLRPLVDYLHDVGQRTEGHKWRWLAQAIYLKRYKMNDLPTAYDWAVEMASMDKPDMPAWTKQMPAFIRSAQGDKQAAYDIMVEILRSDAATMDPAEVNFMKDYICTRTLDSAQLKDNPLCADIKD